jgi:hypothetical protein
MSHVKLIRCILAISTGWIALPAQATECQLPGCNKAPKVVPSEEINAFFKNVEAEEKKPGAERYEQLSTRFSFLVDCGPPFNFLSRDILKRANDDGVHLDAWAKAQGLDYVTLKAFGTWVVVNRSAPEAESCKLAARELHDGVKALLSGKSK